MRTLGIILAGGSSERRLKELTDYRAAAAMPIGGSYRTIDFAMSNMSNSGINKVAVITQYNSRSLHDHLTSSKWWDFGRKKGGLFVFNPFLSRDNSYWFRGTADAIYQNMPFMLRSNEDYVVIASGDAVYKMDYNDAIQYHIDKGADMTIIYKKMENCDLTKFGIMELDEDGRITDFEEKPLDPFTNCASLGIYIISRTLLIDLINEIVSEGRYDIVKDIIERYRRKLKIYGYEFKGYWSCINGGVMDYYNTNMDFLKKDIRDLFTKDYPYIETKPKDEPPAKYNYQADVSNAIVGSGTIINGKIEDSILFRRVYIGEETKIKASIIMEDSYIGKNCVVEYAIIDKDVYLSDGKKVIGRPDEPIILRKGFRL